ncbi:hypothetical protein BAUCODRAFT_232304 [Baudoinia panamericana UAMH 10762]|uniref:Uncharacterized protein n=1 Tax=Baudoinia panamericana (strain UAMH 10762) TaxID=717646 RepID=M2N3B1_BAUPA|nr:uncharacterized protein BAUCODRAFT_232304 [Baudoinia panamericana UAMH 10762]EMC93200.1 hypothetical protein BAUCODRAFT_232304 [Baudoinia panamericana UAMH 10762]
MVRLLRQDQPFSLLCMRAKAVFRVLACSDVRMSCRAALRTSRLIMMAAPSVRRNASRRLCHSCLRACLSLPRGLSGIQLFRSTADEIRLEYCCPSCCTASEAPLAASLRLILRLLCQHGGYASSYQVSLRYEKFRSRQTSSIQLLSPSR